MIGTYTMTYSALIRGGSMLFSSGCRGNRWVSTSVNRIPLQELCLQKSRRTLGGAHTHFRWGEWFCASTGFIQPIAVKEASLTRAEREPLSAAAASRLRQEAEMLHTVRHPYLLHCHGICEEKDPESSERYIRLVMEACYGDTLCTHIPYAPLDRKLLWLQHVCQAMTFIHESGIIHRDIKTSNIFLANECGAVRIGDFDSAIHISSLDTIATEGDKFGTLTHMAPESLSEGRFSKASDVYAFGIMAFEVIEGVSAYHGRMSSGVPGCLTQEEFVSEVIEGRLRPSADDTMISKHHVRSGLERIQREHALCGDDVMRSLRALCVQCWDGESRKRPSFSDLELEIGIIREKLRAKSRNVIARHQPSFADHHDDLLGKAEKIGNRKTMEDSTVLIRGEWKHRESGLSEWVVAGGVLDGHGGAEVSKFAADSISRVIKSRLGQSYSTESGDDFTPPSLYSVSAVEILREVERLVQLKMSRDTTCSCGSTSTLVTVTENDIHVAWLGDSTAILCQARKGEMDNRSSLSTNDVVVSELTTSHIPEEESERTRVEDYGGTVGRTMRMMDDGCEYPSGPFRVYTSFHTGGLAVARALGDTAMRPYISGVPSSRIYARTERDLFLVIATDGVWDVLSAEEVSDIVLSPASENRRNLHNAEESAAKIIDEALSRGSQDNVSAVVIMLSKFFSQ